MLQIDKVQQIEGVTVYADHEQINVFYPLPQQPRYRLDALGRPSFSFFKYRFPVDHPDGRKGGGFLLFDVEFVVDETTLVKVKEKLAEQVAAEANRLGIAPVPDVVIGAFTYTQGTSSLQYPEGLVTKTLRNGAPPSLFGNNVTTFALELPPEGATFFEQAMQGSGGAVSVVYDLWFWARLPAVEITANFNASKFYSFYQTIDTEWNFWGEDDYRETVREQMIQSESMRIDINWGGVTDEKVRGSATRLGDADARGCGRAEDDPGRRAGARRPAQGAGRHRGRDPRHQQHADLELLAALQGGADRRVARRSLRGSLRTSRP